MNAAKYTNWKGVARGSAFKPINSSYALDLLELIKNLLEMVSIGDEHGEDALEVGIIRVNIDTTDVCFLHPYYSACDVIQHAWAIIACDLNRREKLSVLR